MFLLVANGKLDLQGNPLVLLLILTDSVKASTLHLSGLWLLEAMTRVPQILSCSSFFSSGH